MPQLEVNPFSGFAGALRTVLADVNYDGVADVVVATADSSSHVMAFDGVSGAPLLSFLAFPGFSGGVTLAAGDVDGDGAADLVVGTEEEIAIAAGTQDLPSALKAI